MIDSSLHARKLAPPMPWLGAFILDSGPGAGWHAMFLTRI